MLRACVTRRGKGEPLQYITGESVSPYHGEGSPRRADPRPKTGCWSVKALALLPAAPKRMAQHAWPEDDLPPVPWPEGEAGEQRPERTADQGVAEDESTPAVASGEPAPEPPELLVARPLHRFRLHRLLRRLRASARARGGDRHRARGRRARSRQRGCPRAGRPRRGAVVRSGRGRRSYAHGRVRPRGVQPAVRAHGRHGRYPPRGGRIRARARHDDGGADGRRAAACFPGAAALKRRRLRLELHETCLDEAARLAGRPASPMFASRPISPGAPASSLRSAPCRRIFGAARFPCEPRRFRQVAASRAGRTGLCAAGCTVSPSDVRQKRGFGSHRPVQLLLRRMPKRNPRSRFAIPAKRGVRAGRRCQNLDFCCT